MVAAVDWDLERLTARIAEARRGRDLGTISLEIGVQPSSLQHLETGELPQMAALMRMCSWLGTTVDEFIR